MGGAILHPLHRVLPEPRQRPEPRLVGRVQHGDVGTVLLLERAHALLVFLAGHGILLAQAYGLGNPGVERTGSRPATVRSLPERTVDDCGRSQSDDASGVDGPRCAASGSERGADGSERAAGRPRCGARRPRCVQSGRERITDDPLRVANRPRHAANRPRRVHNRSPRTASGPWRERNRPRCVANPPPRVADRPRRAPSASPCISNRPLRGQSHAIRLQSRPRRVSDSSARVEDPPLCAPRRSRRVRDRSLRRRSRSARTSPSGSCRGRTGSGASSSFMASGITSEELIPFGVRSRPRNTAPRKSKMKAKPSSSSPKPARRPDPINLSRSADGARGASAPLFHWAPQSAPAAP